MANFAVVDWTSSISDAKTVAAEIEAYLETIDSSTNAIVMSQIIPCSNSQCQAIIIHQG